MKIPEGWPTEEMLQRGYAVYNEIINGFEPDGFDAIAAAFKEMYEAAPTPLEGKS